MYLVPGLASGLAPQVEYVAAGEPTAQPVCQPSEGKHSAGVRSVVGRDVGSFSSRNEITHLFEARLTILTCVNHVRRGFVDPLRLLIVDRIEWLLAVGGVG